MSRVISFSADYYDGKSARRIAATITVIGDTVVVAGDGASTDYARASVRVQPQLRGTPRRLEFADGSAAVTDDHSAVEAAFGVGASKTLAHRLESNLGFVFAAMIGVGVAVALGYFYGVPWASREIAQRLPIGIESQLAEASIKSLDQAIFEPSTLDAAKKAEILAAFTAIRAATALPSAVRLEFRDGGWIGANALALPGGVIVVTDQLVEIMPGTNETIAVLAHELGHVESRHSLRQLLQSSISGLAAAAIYGDVGSLMGMVATAPTVLATTGFSRDFEREADTFAFALLKKVGRSPKSFATAMKALEQSHAAGRKQSKWRKKLGLPESESEPAPTPIPSKAPEPPRTEKKSEFGYLSTHPATEERIRAAEAAALDNTR
ncbi:MAG: M48 family metallopeptidase [Usitatibacteraceae bacterium]